MTFTRESKFSAKPRSSKALGKSDGKRRINTDVICVISQGITPIERVKVHVLPICILYQEVGDGRCDKACNRCKGNGAA